MGVTSYKAGNRTFWKADYRIKDATHREKRIVKCRIPTREMAEALIQKARIEIFEGTYFEKRERKSLTVEKAYQNFEPTLKLSVKDWTTDAKRASHVIRVLGHREASSLDQKDIDEYRLKRQLDTTAKGKPPAISTVNREVAFLRHFLNHAVKRRELRDNPLAGVKMLPENNVRDVYVTEPEFRRLLDCAEELLKPILITAYETGMRKREVLDLEWKQVNLKDMMIRLSPEDTKTKRPRTIILTDRVHETLDRLPRSLKGYVFVNPETGKPWVQIQKMFDRARKAAGLTNIWFHDLRRSFVTNARRRGVPESVVMKMSGHKDRSVFDRYNIVSEDDIRSAVLVIERGREVELEKANRV